MFWKSLKGVFFLFFVWKGRNFGKCFISTVHLSFSCMHKACGDRSAILVTTLAWNSTCIAKLHTNHQLFSRLCFNCTKIALGLKSQTSQRRVGHIHLHSKFTLSIALAPSLGETESVMFLNKKAKDVWNEWPTKYLSQAPSTSTHNTTRTQTAPT